MNVYYNAEANLKSWTELVGHWNILHVPVHWRRSVLISGKLGDIHFPHLRVGQYINNYPTILMSNKKIIPQIIT